MKILSINKADRVGGAAELAYALDQQLITLGHQVDFFVDTKVSDSSFVKHIAQPRALFYLSHLLGTDIDLFLTDRIIDTPEFKAADIIHCHNLHGHYFNLETLVKMSRLKPVVWTLHDLWALTPYCSHSFAEPDADGFYTCPANASRSWMKCHRAKYLQARKAKLYGELGSITLVAPSLWLKSKLANSCLSNQFSHLIHNGINLTNRPDRRQSQLLRSKLSLPADKKIILFVASGGKDNIWKGWSYTEQVIRELSSRSDLLFLCIGGAPMDNPPANLRFVSYLDQSALAEYYACADVFLLSSTAESFALVLLEAMFAGLPVVSFSVGAAPELITHRHNGYLAKSYESSGLIAGLDQVLAFNQHQLDDILLSNQKLITKSFSLTAMTSAYLELYQSILTSKQK